MKYLSYQLKQLGREGLQPLALFAKWPFQNGIQFGARLLAAIETKDDLSQLIKDGQDFDMREEAESEFLALEKSNMEAQSTRLRQEADTIDLFVANVIDPKIAEVTLAAKPIA